MPPPWPPSPCSAMPLRAHAMNVSFKVTHRTVRQYNAPHRAHIPTIPAVRRHADAANRNQTINILIKHESPFPRIPSFRPTGLRPSTTQFAERSTDRQPGPDDCKSYGHKTRQARLLHATRAACTQHARRHTHTQEVRRANALARSRSPTTENKANTNSCGVRACLYLLTCNQMMCPTNST